MSRWFNIARCNFSTHKKFIDDTRSVAAVEFAVGSMVIFLFMFSIINLGSLALDDYGLWHAVSVSGREISAKTDLLLSQSSSVTSRSEITSADCPSSTEIQSDFAASASPVFASASLPSLSVSWWGSLVSCGTASSISNVPPGGGLLLSASYPWVAVAAPGLFPAWRLTLTASLIVPVIQAPP